MTQQYHTFWSARLTFFLTDDGLHFLLGNCNKFLHLVPVVLLFTAQKQETMDKSTYKVKEYYSYNEYSFYDLENVIDSSGRRQIQPDPKQNYHHTDPWAKKEKSSAQLWKTAVINDVHKRTVALQESDILRQEQKLLVIES